LTDVRLLLGERLGCGPTTDADALADRLGRRAGDAARTIRSSYLAAYYDFMTWLQESLTQASWPEQDQREGLGAVEARDTVHRAGDYALPVVDAPIGIFDSSFGGLTVARAVLDQLPHESVIYLGDTARQPYWSRPIAQVRKYSVDVLDRLV
jgi:hypothetical protein